MTAYELVGYAMGLWLVVAVAFVVIGVAVEIHYAARDGQDDER